MIQTPETPITHPGPLSLPLEASFSDDSSGSPNNGQDQKSPTISDTTTRSNSLQLHAAVALRRRGGNLSHLSESDRRSEFSYRSESISVAASEHNFRTGSKFKVVKLGDKIPYVRGRFVCFDFHDIPNKDGNGRGEAAAAVLQQLSGMAVSRIQTPDSLTTGPGGTLTSSSTGLPPLSVVSGMDAGDGGSSLGSTQADPAPLHNLHHSAAVPSQPAPSVGIIQRTGTLVHSPVLPKPSPSFSSPNPTKSPLPPLSTAGYFIPNPFTTVNSPEPSRLLPVYFADGTQKEPVFPSYHNSTANNSPPDHAHVDGAQGPRRSIPESSDGIRRNLQTPSEQVRQANQTSSDHIDGPRRNFQTTSDQSRQSFQTSSDHADGPRRNFQATSDHVDGPRRNFQTPSDQVRHHATASPASSNAGSRKVSAANAPDPSRLLRMKGETYFAEMIDRVWETAGATRNGDSSTAAGSGFDRIEAKISQCMSLVTEHVLMAVRVDLDQLTVQARVMKERTTSLEYENHALRTENVLLRNAVNNPPPAPSVSAMHGTPVEPSRSRMK
ncbi:hypothetical protein BV898_10045 [Hypsibius exemplaris]|uniref:Uncharacterized protein n=1 Tax=Hypsibius exemplaris TaxID=2072580 RepID=A0A1W0WKU2_HYPEX|nr:hypothetical protein BV898_10045 [Hypsibius exemplaris]